MLVLLVSPLLSFEGSELLGLGAALPGAVPDGAFDIDDPPEEPGDIAVPGIAVDDEEDGLIVDDEDGLMVDDDLVDVLSDVVGEGVGIVELESVFGIAGGSVLLQAPSTANVAARATHLIELRMFTPRGSVRKSKRAPFAAAAESAIARTPCQPSPKAR